MSVKLSAEDQSRAEKLVGSGRFSNINEVLHAGLEALEEDENWRQYARDRIQRGLDDIAAGRTVSGEEFLDQLRKARLPRA